MNEKSLEELQRDLCMTALAILEKGEDANSFYLSAEVDSVLIDIDVNTRLDEEQWFS